MLFVLLTTKLGGDLKFCFSSVSTFNKSIYEYDGLHFINLVYFFTIALLGFLLPGILCTSLNVDSLSKLIVSIVFDLLIAKIYLFSAKYKSRERFF